MMKIVRTNKYHNKKVEMDGILFDSNLEAQRWMYLRCLEKEGKITELRRQVPFLLIPAQYELVEQTGKNGKPIKPKRVLVERQVAYKADFVYKVNDTIRVEDTKGLLTPEYVIKRKLMRQKGYAITQVKKPCQPVAGL